MNEAAESLLTGNFKNIQLQGEVSRRLISGHGYVFFDLEEFDLEETKFKISCILFQRNAIKLPDPIDGQKVIVTGTLSLYGPSGKYQFIVNSLKPSGAGTNKLYKDLKEDEYRKKGWFRSNRQIPAKPNIVSIITSFRGDALDDVKAVFSKRLPSTELRLLDVPVQGEEAPGEIASAVQAANKEGEADVIVLCRGGGADLRAFDDGIVVESIFESNIPVVTGIGHENDTTNADKAADHPASTPTAAAEHVCRPTAIKTSSGRVAKAGPFVTSIIILLLIAGVIYLGLHLGLPLFTLNFEGD